MEVLEQNKKYIFKSEQQDSLEAAKELIILARELDKTIVESWELIEFPNMSKIEELAVLANAAYMGENISLICVDNNNGKALPLMSDFLIIPVDEKPS